MLQALGEAVVGALPQRHALAELSRFYALVRDYPARGGKRLRGQLLLAAIGAHGGDWRAGVGVAAALELFQNWVLIHDDVEDDSEDRRGLPALHRCVGAPVAINVGDALHVYMWQLLHSQDGLASATQRAVLAEFAWMIQRTAEGQHLDLAWVEAGRFDVSEAEYLDMVRLKTAYYTVVCPLRLGALCAGEEPRESLSEAGIDLGVAFQIRDDVLNLMPEIAAQGTGAGTGAELGAGIYGKEFMGDLLEGKRTLILAHFFAEAGAAERDEVIQVLAKPRAAKTQGEVLRVLGLIDRRGSLRYAQEVAESSAERGMRGLREALEDQQAGALFDLLEPLASRRH
ncbi:MAG: polyprenyl synthetase family protein [Deinococcota bacterium]|jgi:geranylgeranyl diphosphate synthase type II|nr:polyprenyl synthetase family protein [Deinococcota bacterium]